jgi:hypothetical protein
LGPVDGRALLLPANLKEWPMPTAGKEAAVSELKGLVEGATIVIAAEYRGLARRLAAERGALLRVPLL